MCSSVPVADSDHRHLIPAQEPVDDPPAAGARPGGAAAGAAAPSGVRRPTGALLRQAETAVSAPAACPPRPSLRKRGGAVSAPGAWKGFIPPSPRIFRRWASLEKESLGG